jgi:cytolysin-activating lysine-acyltransferase
MTPVLVQQFRLFYAKGRPLGVMRQRATNKLLWARVDAETEARLKAGTTKLRPQDWKSGDRLWVVEVIAPFGGAEAMVRDLKAKVFPTQELRYVAIGADGKKELKVV